MAAAVDALAAGGVNAAGGAGELAVADGGASADATEKDDAGVSAGDLVRGETMQQVETIIADQERGSRDRAFQVGLKGDMISQVGNEKSTKS